jgi:uncharacterized membrane protein
MRGLTDDLVTTDGASGAQPAVSGRVRLDSIDLVRGVVMVIMALDHVRDYFHAACFPPLSTDPVDLSKTNAALFLTRWVTHFCAPTFVFLAGTGAFLSGTRGKSKGELSWFLLSRGLWLVILEVTLVRLGWSFNFDYAKEFGGGVIWAIGWSMVLMAGLVFLPTSAVALFGVSVVAFHNLLDGKTADEVGLADWLWKILHSPGSFPMIPRIELGSLTVPEIQFGTGYSLLPWLGVMASGYAFGALFLLDREVRRRQLVALGIGLTLLFVALRFSNYYGDQPTNPDNPAGPGAWSKHENVLFTLFSFVNCHKYPPSLLFLLMTLGPAITALGLFDWEVGAVGRFFVTFGRVPLFYYLLHIPLIHGLVVGLDYLRYGWSPFAHHAPWPAFQPGETPADYGYSLPVVYGVWVSVVLMLYPLCRWFAGVKRRYKAAWLSYL